MTRTLQKPRTAAVALTLCLMPAFAQVAAEADDVATNPGPQLVFEDCRVYDKSRSRAIDAQCATLNVAENPERPDGRRIDLFVARVPAIAPTPAADPFTVIQGGPGGSSVDLYITHASAFERLREFRDIVLVDQRGTGRSNPLNCEAPEDEPLEFDPELARRTARECLESMQADPRFYTTSVAVSDLEAVRQALGVAKWNLYGVSYGTRVGLHYLRRHPQRTRTLIIDGVAPADWVLGPDIARFGEQALQTLFERCARDSACTARFGDLEDKFNRLRQRLTAEPATLELPHPVTGQPEASRFTREHLVLATRMLSYQSESLALLPLLISEAWDEDNLTPFAAQSLMVGEELEQALAIGMHNSVVCTEDLPFVQDEGGLENTYMGALQMEALRAICEVWPKGVLDEDFKTPVVSDNPVLVLSGEYDPVTPPENGARAAQSLGNHLEIVAPGQGHGVVMRGCLPRLLARFVDAGQFDSLQPQCVERMAAMPFFFSFSGPQP